MTVQIIHGDCRDVLKTLPDCSVQMCCTSPPYYGLRDYQVSGQIGLEPTPDAYVAEMVAVFREVRRVLRDDGTLWLNIGDSYAAPSKGTGGATEKQVTNAGAFFSPRKFNMGDAKQKDLMGIPWLLAFALRADGWYLRSDIIWHKPNPMPESVRDRPTSAHEHVFLLSKRERYFYDAGAIAEPAEQGEKFHGAYDKRPGATRERNGRDDPDNTTTIRNARNVWTIATQPFSGAKLLSDYVGEDGKFYRRSPDCPIHGLNGVRQILQTAGCGEPSGHLPSRNPGIGADRAAEHEGGRGATPSMRNAENAEETLLSPSAQSRGENKTPGQSQTNSADGLAIDGEPRCRTDDTPSFATLPACASGSLPLGNAPTATPNSNETRKMDPVPATTPPYTASVETRIGTPDTSGQPPLFCSAVRSDESKSDVSGTDERPSGRKVQSSVRRSTSRHNTKEKCLCEQVTTGHFATMPPELAERCIKAGSKPGDTVLDPFGGAGTTGLVADRLNRNAVLIELNPEYRALALDRVRGDAPLLAVVG